MTIDRGIKHLFGECMRKKALKESWADDIIKRAAKEGTELHKYHCPHCLKWHVTKSLKPKPNLGE